MTIFSLFTLCGGLAFFLFGMHIMSSNLEKVAGGRLQSILKVMTSNPFKSLALGAVITIAIQSSSALTVMLVGLVNSGIMDLSQTVGVIMGSNIGTTLTAWILSLSGIQSDNFFLSLLKPENFSPIIALIGVILIMAAKSERKRDIGTILTGFAVLMYGMQMMSDSVSPLADMPQFVNLLTAFNNPIVGVLVGTIFTGIIQSSAASVGVLQALAMTGSITYGMAIPIIMGQNIGTCVTALLSSIGVNKNAKRVSVIHISFNLFGTLIGMIIYFILRYLVGLALFDAAITPVAIAGFHSIFNIVTTIVLLPFGKQLVHLAERVIPTKDEKTESVLLDERLLLSPGLAVHEAKDRTNEMADLARDSFLHSLILLRNYDKEMSDSIYKMEERLDYMEDQLNTFLIKLSGTDIPDNLSDNISEMLHSVNDFERIGDHAINVAKLAEEMKEKHQVFSPEAGDELRVLFDALHEILVTTAECFNIDDVQAASRVEPLEEVIDDLTREIKNRHIIRLQRGECDGELGIFMTDLLTNCERVSDHCSNVAVSVIETSQSSFEAHEYLNNLKKSNDPAFVQEYKNFSDKYRLAPAVYKKKHTGGQSGNKVADPGVAGIAVAQKAE